MKDTNRILSKLFLITVVFSFSCFTLNSQDVQTSTIRFVPVENGYDLNIPFSWKIIWCYGEVSVTIVKNLKDITSSTYIYKGKRYTAADLGQEAFNEPHNGLTSISADVYHNSYLLGRMKMGNVIAVGGLGCFGQTYCVSKQVALEDAGFKDKLNELSLRNFRMENFSSANMFLEAKIDKIEKGKSMNIIISEADKLFLSGDLIKAQSKYEEARKLDYTNPYPVEKLKEIREKLMAEKKAEQEKLDAEKKAEEERLNTEEKASDWSDYESKSEKNSVEKENSNTNNSNTNYSSSNSNISSSNRNNNTNNAQIVYDAYARSQQIEQNRQTMYNAANNIGNLVGNAFASNAAFKEEQRIKRAEEERNKEEEERLEMEKEREIEMAWETMTDFELKFSDLFKKDLNSLSNQSCVYFYFASIAKNKSNKSGSIKLSNVFPVYSYSNGSWP